MCNLNECETVSHLFFDCPLYRGLRGSFIRNIKDLHRLVGVLEDLVLVEARSIFNFINGALRLRSFILNE